MIALERAQRDSKTEVEKALRAVSVREASQRPQSTKISSAMPISTSPLSVQVSPAASQTLSARPVAVLRNAFTNVEATTATQAQVRQLKTQQQQCEEAIALSKAKEAELSSTIVASRSKRDQLKRQISELEVELRRAEEIVKRDEDASLKLSQTVKLQADKLKDLQIETKKLNDKLQTIAANEQQMKSLVETSWRRLTEWKRKTEQSSLEEWDDSDLSILLSLLDTDSDQFIPQITSNRRGNVRDLTYVTAEELIQRCGQFGQRSQSGAKLKFGVARMMLTSLRAVAQSRSVPPLISRLAECTLVSGRGATAGARGPNPNSTGSTADIAMWDTDDVVRFLEAQQLGQIAPVFREEAVYGPLLLEIRIERTQSTLDALGLGRDTALAQRLWKELDKVIQQNAQQQQQQQQSRTTTVPTQFVCPITHSEFTDPVMADDGFTYERQAIADWLQRNNTSPMTREVIGSRLVPNRNLKDMLQVWRAEQSK